MNASISLKLFQITKQFITDEVKAQEFVSKIEETIDEKFESKSASLVTKDDLKRVEINLANVESRLTKTIYIVGLVQFLAIIGSVLAIVNFMLK